MDTRVGSASAAFVVLLFGSVLLSGCERPADLAITAATAYAPAVPPPVGRRGPTRIHIGIASSVQQIELAPGVLCKAWALNGHVPGPFIRARIGDVLEVTATNSEPQGMPHSLEKGAAGMLNVEGPRRPDLYSGR